MFEDFSVERTLGILTLAAIPLFTGCAQFAGYNPYPSAAKDVAAQKAPTRAAQERAQARPSYSTVDKQPLKLIAVANDKSNFETNVVGIDACKKTALAFTDLKASFGTPVQIYAACLPQKGGDPVVNYSCSANSPKGKAAACELK